MNTLDILAAGFGFDKLEDYEQYLLQLAKDFNESGNTSTAKDYLNFMSLLRISIRLQQQNEELIKALKWAQSRVGKSTRPNPIDKALNK